MLIAVVLAVMALVFGLSPGLALIAVALLVLVLDAYDRRLIDSLIEAVR